MERLEFSIRCFLRLTKRFYLNEEKIRLSLAKKKKKIIKVKVYRITLFMKLITASFVFDKTALPIVRRNFFNFFVPHYSGTRHIKIPVTRDSYIKIRFLETNLSTQLAKVLECSGRSFDTRQQAMENFINSTEQRSDFSYFRYRNSFVLVVRSIAFYRKLKRGKKK